MSSYKILYKKISGEKNRPYWNFWRVILAGWVIRYPRTVFRVTCIPIGIMIILIYKMLNG
jgi:hypothetical protein